jgi:hypothetical protein
MLLAIRWHGASLGFPDGIGAVAHPLLDLSSLA